MTSTNLGPICKRGKCLISSVRVTSVCTSAFLNRILWMVKEWENLDTYLSPLSDADNAWLANAIVRTLILLGLEYA